MIQDSQVETVKPELSEEEKLDIMSGPPPQLVEEEPVKVEDKKEEKKDEPVSKQVVEPEKKRDSEVAPTKKVDQDKVEKALEGDKFIEQQLNIEERGLFREIRHQRERARNAEREVERLKFHEAQRKAQEEAKKDPEEVLTRKQVTEEFQRKLDERSTAIETSNRNRLVKIWDREARREHKDDYDKVMSLADKIIGVNSNHQAKISEAYEEGDNVALVMYDLIKLDPAFAKLAKEAGIQIEEDKPHEEKKSSSNPQTIEAAKKLAENAAKTPTTGSSAAGGGSTLTPDEITFDYVASLSDAEFAKLPKDKRNAILAKFG